MSIRICGDEAHCGGCKRNAPLTGVELAAKLGTKPLSRAAYELNLQNVGMRTVYAPTAVHKQEPCVDRQCRVCYPAPPAEMPAPTPRVCWHCKKPATSEWSYGKGDEWILWCGSRDCGPVGTGFYGIVVRPIKEPVARDASVDAPDSEVDCPDCGPGCPCEIGTIDRLRTELAAEKKRADEAMETARITKRVYYERRSNDLRREEEAHASTRTELAAANEEIARMHASMKLIRDAAKQALDDRDALHAKLGRTVDILRRLLGEHANADEFRTIRMQADAILADADR